MATGAVCPCMPRRTSIFLPLFHPVGSLDTAAAGSLEATDIAATGSASSQRQHRLGHRLLSGGYSPSMLGGCQVWKGTGPQTPRSSSVGAYAGRQQWRARDRLIPCCGLAIAQKVSCAWLWYSAARRDRRRPPFWPPPHSWLCCRGGIRGSEYVPALSPHRQYPFPPVTHRDMRATETGPLRRFFPPGGRGSVWNWGDGLGGWWSRDSRAPLPQAGACTAVVWELLPAPPGGMPAQTAPAPEIG